MNNGNGNSNGNGNTTKEIYFKYSRTVNTHNLEIDCSWTLDYFIQHVKNKINNPNIELVKTMQEGIWRFSEDAPALLPDSDITIYEIFKDDWNQNQLAFYIRLINPDNIETNVVVENNVSSAATMQEEEEEEEEEGEEEEEEEPESSMCSVCLDNFPTTDYTPFGCQHYLCNTCYKGCIDVNIRSCPTCRQG